MSRVLICSGAVWIAPYDFQLTLTNGIALTGSYRGPGKIVRQNNRVVCIIGNPVWSTEWYFVADDPTESSLEYVRGYRHAERQIRRRQGSTWSRRFVDGWRQCWTDRDRGYLNPVFRALF